MGYRTETTDVFGYAVRYPDMAEFAGNGSYFVSTTQTWEDFAWEDDPVAGNETMTLLVRTEAGPNEKPHLVGAWVGVVDDDSLVGFIGG